jgi:hypothetical protein
MTVVAHFFERAFAVELLFKPPQRFVYGLAFFQSNFGQSFLTPLYPGLSLASGSRAA